MAEWMPGEKPQPPGTDDLYWDLGTSLAQFHVAADRFRSSRPRRTVRTGSEVREVCDALDLDPPRRRLVEGAAAEAQRQISRLADQGLHRGTRHGDASLDNVHVSDSGLHFYDLDLAGPGWQAEDLTPALSTGTADALLAGQNLHFHLVRRPTSEGTASRAGGGVEAGFEALAAAVGPLGLDS